MSIKVFSDIDIKVAMVCQDKSTAEKMRDEGKKALQEGKKKMGDLPPNMSFMKDVINSASIGGSGLNVTASVTL